MANPVAVWITPPGIRRTNAGDKTRVLVASRAVGGLDKVTFNIDDGVSPFDVDVTAEDLWLPDFSDFDDPTTGDLQSAVIAYGYALDMGTLPNGPIIVTATAYPTTGSSYELPVATFYNNKTSDTRPSAVQVYMSPTGSNANDGSTSSVPILNLMRACQLGTSGGFTGGLEVFLMAGTHTMASGIWFDSTISGPTNDHCYWITLKPAPGVAREDIKLQYEASDFLEFKAANKVRLRFQDLTSIGRGFWIAGTTNDTISTWFEHCLVLPLDPALAGLTDPHIDAHTQNSEIQSTTNAYQDFRAFTGCTWNNTATTAMASIHGCTYGIVHGNLFLNTAGIPVYCHGPNIYVGCNKLQGHRGNGGIQGHMSVTGTMSIIESPVNAGKVRVVLGSVTSNFLVKTGVNEPVNAAAALVGSTMWGLDRQGFPVHGDGTAYVLGAGNDGSNDWVDLDLTYISDEAAAGSRTLVTALEHDVTGIGSARLTYINGVHVNGPFYTDAGLVSNFYCAHNYCVDSFDLYAGIRFDSDGSGADLLRICVVDNVGFRYDVDLDATSTMNDFILDRNAMSQLYITSGQTVGADVEITNNIIGGITYPGGSKAALEAKLDDTLVHHNHFVVSGDQWWSGTGGSTGDTVGGGADPFAAGDFLDADAAGNWQVDSGSTAFGAATGAYGPAPWNGDNQGPAGLGALEGNWLLSTPTGLTVPRVEPGSTVYAPALGLSIAVPLIAPGSTVYQPTLSGGAAPSGPPGEGRLGIGIGIGLGIAGHL